MSIKEAENRVRLYRKNKQWAEFKGYELLPSNKERKALVLLGLIA